MKRKKSPRKRATPAKRAKKVAAGFKRSRDAKSVNVDNVVEPVVDPLQIYKRLVRLIESRSGSPRVRGPGDRLREDLLFTDESLGAFADDINREFADLNVKVTRKEVRNCKTVGELAALIVAKARARAK